MKHQSVLFIVTLQAQNVYASCAWLIIERHDMIINGLSIVSVCSVQYTPLLLKTFYEKGTKFLNVHNNTYSMRMKT